MLALFLGVGSLFFLGYNALDRALIEACAERGIPLILVNGRRVPGVAGHGAGAQ